MWAKRIIALTLFAALAAMPTCVLRAQWVRTGGFYSGSVTAFTQLSPSLNSPTLWLVSAGSLYQSQDNGASWTELTTPMKNFSALDFTGPLAFAAAGNHVYLSSGGDWYEADSGLAVPE